MKIFECGHCAHPLFFESIVCEQCGHWVGYNDAKRMMNTFGLANDEHLISDRGKEEYRFCKNKEHDVCNWLVKADSDEQYCSACQLNRTIPDLSDKSNFEKWQNMEIAKHRLIYQLHRMGLALPSKKHDENGLCFDFLAKEEGQSIMTGHASGVITILLSEADSVFREQMRIQMSEPYRTLIGHFRHEVGHYFWDQLVAIDEDAVAESREIFGDERRDYGEALNSYYATGAPEDWQDHFISKYATSHPWEDWAETWAHYLHIMDVAETAYYFGLCVDPIKGFVDMHRTINFDPYEEPDFDKIVDTCIPLLFAVNSINRSMGIPDVYPFVINSTVIKKLNFIHEVVKK